MFEAKGSGILSIIEFVKTNFGDEGYTKWLAALSPDARTLATQTVLATNWYPGPLTMEMRRKLCDVFFDGSVRGARELGRFSANKGLRGIYRMAVKLGSPRWVAERASVVFESYFRPGKVTVEWENEKSAFVRFSEQMDTLGIMEEVFSGFIEVALELSGAKNVVIERSTRPRQGSGGPEVHASWQ